ncbi:hypothetical protein EIN_153110 [Entamoeba invadens IP1]|uniref:Leucine rich repeat containing protein BspA family protein n=1 Tax=Entamoeba invadens IP1 TaxID=370355 RepID=A0A0A1U8S4_ENTIV|nr:hypothetical protein EIN_153110 [Entamoeba invadens IP1]ELP91304.1 hypothetical protein EIN_153110 [Entamoeba invadens IP1]|eukprot:XP_004258075.1 hypothetical protein EIN_153110 [Entamoeba invadens IP1]
MSVSLDRYSMMIVSKYFDSINDFLTLIKVCKKYLEIPSMFHYNPVSINNDNKKLFPNVETLHLYVNGDWFHDGYFQYSVDYPCPIKTIIKIRKNKRVMCKAITYSSDDIYHNIPYTEATYFIHDTFAGRYRAIAEMDCSKVIYFGSSCFLHNHILSRITLSSNLHEIPKNCFYECTSLQSLNLEHVHSFGYKCFENCKSLSALTLSDYITQVEEGTFENLFAIKSVCANKLKELPCYINASYTKAFEGIKHKIVTSDTDVRNGISLTFLTNRIDHGAFSRISGLSNVDIPTTVTYIGSAFYDSDLKRLDLSFVEQFRMGSIPKITAITTNSKIDIYCLHDCETLKKIDSYGSNYINGNVACWMKSLLEGKNIQVKNYCYSRKDYKIFDGIIPEYANSIDSCIVFGDSNHCSIIFPQNLNFIPHPYFFNNNIKKIILPKLFIPRDRFSFEQMEAINLEEIALNPAGYFYFKNNVSLTSVTFLDKTIHQHLMFKQCSKLVTITVENTPENYTFNDTMEISVFKYLKDQYKCSGDVILEQEEPLVDGVLHVLEGVTLIKSHCYLNDMDLKEIWMSTTVQRVENQAFLNCSNLKLVKLQPRKVKIHKKAFKQANKDIAFVVIQNN